MNMQTVTNDYSNNMLHTDQSQSGFACSVKGGSERSELVPCNIYYYNSNIQGASSLHLLTPFTPV